MGLGIGWVCWQSGMVECRCERGCIGPFAGLLKWLFLLSRKANKSAPQKTQKNFHPEEFLNPLNIPITKTN